MKKTLLKIAIYATMALTTLLEWSPPVSTSNIAFFLEKPSLSKLSTHTIQFSHFFGLHTDENLKTYHLGLKALFPDHLIPSSIDLLTAIRLHPHFIGLQTQTEALNLWNKQEKPYLIFEKQGRIGPHFYIAHSLGLRHFTVNQKAIAGLDNGHELRFPHLEHLIRSTIIL